MKSLPYSQWELMLTIYQRQAENRRSLSIQCNKSLLKACIKKGFILEKEDGTVYVTEKGIEAAKEITPLYNFEPLFGYPH